MNLHWELAAGPDPTVVQRCSAAMDLPEPIARLLVQRGVDTPEKVHAFLHPSVDQLWDPFLMDGMEAAVNRVAAVIAAQAPILVSGDYDADGVTATAILCRLFRHLHAPARYHVPQRLTEGYGLSIQTIEQARAQGIRMLVTVDCGTNAHAELDYARRHGIECVVCDHHQPEPPLPAAVAVLNPHRDDCGYPFRDLSGAGIAFKLAQALVSRLGAPPAILNEALALTAIGTIADMVPLVGENRVLAREGLRVLNTRPPLGVEALVRAAGMEGPRRLQARDVLFLVGPRLNAAGRVDHAAAAVDLLVTADAEEARRLAEQLNTQNQTRRRIDEQITADAHAAVQDCFDPDRDAAIVLAREGWHAGVIGIVASRLAERYHRPAVVIALSDGLGRGSARSIPGFDLYALLSACEEYLDSFGGHPYAAGFSIRADRIEAFRQAVLNRAAVMLTPDLKVRKLTIDTVLPLGDITDQVVQHLRAFAPFGHQNPKPVLLARNVQIVGRPCIVGANHLKFQVRQEGSLTLDAIGYNKGDRLEDLNGGVRELALAYHLEEETWRGRTAPVLNIQDVKTGTDGA